MVELMTDPYSRHHDTAGRGSESELRVALEVAERGGRVAFPFGHSQPYDLITDFNGVLSRVQVKRSWYEAAGDRWSLDVRKRLKLRSRDPQVKTPNIGGFDFLIAHAGAHMYVIPQAHIVGRTGFVIRTPDCRPRASRSGPPSTRFEPFLDAWHLLQGLDSDATGDHQLTIA